MRTSSRTSFGCGLPYVPASSAAATTWQQSNVTYVMRMVKSDGLDCRSGLLPWRLGRLPGICISKAKRQSVGRESANLHVLRCLPLAVLVYCENNLTMNRLACNATDAPGACSSCH